MSLELNIDLALDDSGAIRGIIGSQRNLKKLQNQAQKTSGAITEIGDKSEWSLAKLRDVLVTTSITAHAISHLSSAVTAYGSSLIGANAEIERMNTLLLGLQDRSLEFAEKQARTNKELEYLLDLTQSSPVNLNALSDAFVKLKTAGLDPTQGSLQALTDSIARFGGTDEQFKRASIAIQQMSGKGVVSMEELRQQLGEAIPDALKTMSDALGLEIGQLTKEVSMGTVAASSAIDAMLNQMAIQNEGYAKEMSKTWNGTVQRLQSKWMIFQKEVGDAGAFDELKSALTEFTDGFLGSEEAFQLATKLGGALADIIRVAADVVEFAYEWADALEYVAKALIAMKILSVVNNNTATLGKTFKSTGATVVSSVANMARSFDKSVTSMAAGTMNIGKTYKSTLREIQGLNKSYYSMVDEQASRMHVINDRVRASGVATATAFNSIGSSARTAAAGIRSFGLSVSSMVGGPFGIMVLSAEAMLFAYDEMFRKTDKLKDKLSELDARYFKEEDVQDQKEIIKTLRDDLDEYRNDLFYLEKERENMAASRDRHGVGTGGYRDRDQAVQNYDRRIEEMKAKISEAEREIEAGLSKVDAAYVSIAKRQGEQAFKVIKNNLESAIDKANQDIKSGSEAITAEAKKVAEASLKEGEDLIKKQSQIAGKLRKELVEKSYAPILSKITDEIAEAKAQYSEYTSQSSGLLLDNLTQDQKSRATELSQQIKLLEDLANTYQNRIDKADTSLTRMENQGNKFSSPKKDTLQEYVNRTNKALEKLKAKSQEVNPHLAELNELLTQGVFKGKDGSKYTQDDELFIEAKKIAESRFEVEKAIKSENAANETKLALDSKLIEMQKQLDLAKQKSFEVMDESSEKIIKESDASIKAEASIQALIESATADGALSKESVLEKFSKEFKQIRQAAKDIDDVNQKIKDFNQNAKDMEFKNSISDRISRQTQAAKEALMSERQIEEQNHLERLRRLDEYYKELERKGLATEEFGKKINKAKEAENERYATRYETRVQSLAHEWNDTAKQIENFQVATWNSASAALTDYLVEGELDFDKFAQSILKMILEIQIKKAMAGIVSGIGSAIGGYLGGGATAGAQIDTNPVSFGSTLQFNSNTVGITPHANGGIFGASGSIPLNAYSNGGIAKEPQLALFGEGRMNEAYVPLPDGKTIPVTMSGGGAPNVVVNVINKGGKDMDAKQGKSHFDGKKMILDVVLTEANRPGGFRTGMKEALNG